MHFEQNKEEIWREIVQRDGTECMRPSATSAGDPDTRINTTNCDKNDLYSNNFKGDRISKVSAKG